MFFIHLLLRLLLLVICHLRRNDRNDLEHDGTQWNLPVSLVIFSLKEQDAVIDYLRW